jgi:hypothetical protein
MTLRPSRTFGKAVQVLPESDMLNAKQAMGLLGRMLAVAAVVGLVVFVGMPSVMAAERINTNRASCASIQSVLVEDGSAILRYPSKRVGGLVLYDRYVGDSRRCDRNKIAVWASVPAKDDRTCRVIACQTFDRDDLFPRGPFLKPYLRLRVGS